MHMSSSLFNPSRIARQTSFTITLALILVIGFFVFVTDVHAATTYYVSATNGNDTWSGTLADPNGTNTDGPFKTLQKAQTTMQSSTTKTVTVRGGTYSIAGTSISFTSSDAGETWIPYQNEIPIIDGGGTGYLTGGPSTLTFEGFTLQNLGTSIDGQSFHWGSSGGTFRWNTFTNCLHNCFGGQMSNVTFDSNTINGAGTGGFHGAIVGWYSASNNKITHNLIQNSAEEGVDLGNNNYTPTMSNNIIDRNIVNGACINTADCGAIYLADSAQTSTGDQITNN